MPEGNPYNPFATLIASMTKSIVSRVAAMQTAAVSSLIHRMDQIDEVVAKKSDSTAVVQALEAMRGLIGTNGLELTEAQVDAIVENAFAAVQIGPQPLPPGSNGLIGENGLIGTNGRTLIGENGLIGTNGLIGENGIVTSTK